MPEDVNTEATETEYQPGRIAAQIVDERYGTPEERAAAQESPEVRLARAEAEARIYKEQAEQARQPQAQAQPQQPQVDPVTEIQKQISDLKIPELAEDGSNAWQVTRAERQRDDLRFQLQEAREEKRQEQLLDMQSRTVINDFKARAKAEDPEEWKAIEQQFEQTVANLKPDLKSNPQILQITRNNLVTDYLRGKQRQPQAPVSGATQAYGANPKPKQQKPQLSDEQQQVAAMYGMSPEEYTDPKYQQTAYGGDGNAIYNMPTGVVERLRRFRVG